MVISLVRINEGVFRELKFACRTNKEKVFFQFINGTNYQLFINTFVLLRVLIKGYEMFKLKIKNLVGKSKSKRKKNVFG